MLGIQIFYEVWLFSLVNILLAQSLVPRRRGESLETRLAQRMGWTELERDITDYAYFTIFFPLMIHKVERLCKEVPIDDPSKCPCAEEWDGMTLETWKHQTLWTNGEKCVWVSQVVTICTLGTVISLSLKLTYPNYLNLEGKLYWNSENHEIYMAQHPCDLHVRTLNFKAKSWLIRLWLWGLLVCSKLYCDWSVHHWNLPNFIMKGKYWYAPEIMSLSSCIKVIPQYCTANPVLCITSHNWAVCIQAFWEHGIIFFSINEWCKCVIVFCTSSVTYIFYWITLLFKFSPLK